MGFQILRRTISVPAIIQGGVEFRVSEVILTSAQIKALRATPIAVAPAPGAGKFLTFQESMLYLKAGANVLTAGAGDDMAIRYKDGTGAIASQTIETTGFLVAAVDTVSYAVQKVDPIVAKTVAENQPLVLHNTGAAEFAGNAAADAKLVIRTCYAIHTLPA